MPQPIDGRSSEPKPPAPNRGNGYGIGTSVDQFPHRALPPAAWRAQNGIGISAKAGSGAQAGTLWATIAPTSTIEGEARP